MLAEDLLLLLTDDETGRHLADSTSLDYALGGAVLIDLVHMGKARIAEVSGVFKSNRVEVIDPNPTGDFVLDEAIAKITKRKPQTPQSLVPILAKGLRQQILERLANRAILHAEEGRIMGIFPTTRWPATDSRHEAQIRRGLHEALVIPQSAPNQEVAALISLLHAVNQIPKTITDSGLGSRELKRRAKAIADTEQVGKAVAYAAQAAMGG